MASHESHGHEHAAHDTTPKSKSSFSAAFWFVLLLVGLFIASLNFIDVMSHSGGHEESDAANIESVESAMESTKAEAPASADAAHESPHEAGPVNGDTVRTGAAH